MKSLHIRAVCAAVAMAASACQGDPTADLRGGAASIDVVPGTIYIDEGKGTSLVITVRDEQLNPLASGIAASSANTAVAKVEVDTTRPSSDSAKHYFVVSAIAPGHTRLNVTGAGLSDSVVVNVLPLVFNGAISTLTPRIGDTVTIQASPVLQFDPATVAVTFPGGELPTMLSKSAASLTMLAPPATVGPLTIDGVVVTYVTGLKVTLPSVTMHPTGDRWAASSSWQTAPDITSSLPASGASVQMLIGLPSANNASVCPEAVLPFGSSGPCWMFSFTVAAPTTLNFATAWATGFGGANPDIDIYACKDSVVSAAAFNANCFEEGGAGATGANPQATGNFAYPAGTHYFVVEYYAACDAAPTSCTTDGKTKTYRITISKP